MARVRLLALFVALALAPLLLLPMDSTAADTVCVVHASRRPSTPRTARTDTTPPSVRLRGSAPRGDLATRRLLAPTACAAFV